MEKRSLLAYEHYRESEQRFEYFILGLSVALVAYVGQTAKLGKMLARKRKREFQPCAFCLRIFLSATRSRTARHNFSRPAGLSMSSLSLIASVTVLA